MKKFIRNNILVGGAVLLLAAKSVLGNEHLENDPVRPQDRGDYFRANELSVDAFGTASVGAHTLNHLSGSRVRNNTRLGAGVGINYFITRHLGLGGDVYSEDLKGSFIDSAAVNVILRLPLGRSGFAPYAYGGGGRQFDLTEAWFAQVGGGIEYRFCRNIGAFVDARWALPEEPSITALAGSECVSLSKGCFSK